MTGALCPACDGKRLKREALSVTFAGLDIGTLAQLPLDRVAEVLAPAAAGRFDATRCASRAAAPRRRRVRAPQRARHRAPRRRRRLGARRRARRAPHAQPVGGEAHRRAAHRRRPASRASRRCGRSASATSRSTAARRRCRPASCSACGWRRRSARTCSASSTCSTSRPPACIPADGEALLAALDAARSGRATRSSSSSTTWRRCGAPTGSSTSAPTPASSGGQVLYSGPPDGLARSRRARTPRATCSPGRAAARAPPRRRRAGSSCAASRATTCTSSTRASRSAC